MLSEYAMSYQLQSQNFKFKKRGLRVGFWDVCSNTLGLEYKQAYELLLKDISLLKSFGEKKSYILKFLSQNPYIYIHLLC
jgi:hypothetical protein